MFSRKKYKKELTIVDVSESTKHQFEAPPLGNLLILWNEMVCGNQIGRGNFSERKKMF